MTPPPSPSPDVLAAEKGEAFTVMVMQGQGWGVIDLAEARLWLERNGQFCRCPKCRPVMRRDAQRLQRN